MATEAPAPDHAVRDRHQIKTVILGGAVLLIVLVAVILAIAYAGALNQYWFLHFPLGYFLLTQGALIFIVAIGLWYVRTQERIDNARNESGDLGR